MLQEDDTLVSKLIETLDSVVITGKLESRNSYGIWKTPLNCTMKILDSNLCLNFASINNNDSSSCNILLKDIISSKLVPIKSTNYYYIKFVTYSHVNNINNRSRTRKSYLFTLQKVGNLNIEDVKNETKLILYKLINNVINFQAYIISRLNINNALLPFQSKKILIFVNPKSGSGTSIKTWNNIVKNILDEALINYDLIITEYANHAKQYILSESYDNLIQYANIVTIGGDGIVYEVINGLSNRVDNLVNILPICPIPGGTGNGLIKSILYENNENYTITNATFLCIKGNSCNLDLSKVTTCNNKSYYSFLILGWGLISDIDILSESMRYLGESRLYLAALYFIAKKKKYKGKLYIHNKNDRYDDDDYFVNMPSLDEHIVDNSEWICIDGNFILVWVLQTSHATASIHSGPDSFLNDGLFQIFVVKDDVSRSDLIQLLIDFDTGKHVDHPKIKRYFTKAYRLVPDVDSSNNNNNNNNGIYTLDGEVIEYGPIQGTIEKGKAKTLKL